MSTNQSLIEFWLRNTLDLRDKMIEPEPLEFIRPDSNYRPYGAVAKLWKTKDQQIMLSGPSETGKSRGILELIDRLLWQYENAQATIVRKTYQDTISTILQTYEKQVINTSLGVTIKKMGGTRPTWYDYPNGSRMWVAGMDKPTRALSAERDLIFVNQAEELSVEEWETLRTRCTGRAGNMPYGQLIGDCNPSHPTHWIKKASDEGRLVMLESRHKDNPVLFDPISGDITDRGRTTLSVLRDLTGVRKKRLCDGIWAAAEGMVYEDVWDPNIHVVERAHILQQWPRYWSIDFGFTNPLVWQAWAMDGDGRLIRYKEIYFSGRTVEDHLSQILKLTYHEPRPQAIICDHDAEDRATFEKHCVYCQKCERALTREEGYVHRNKLRHQCHYFDLKTIPAFKAISPGIQGVTERLKLGGDGLPRMVFMKESLKERDEKLSEKHKPCSTEQEFEGYVWPKSASGKPIKEVPVQADDHGMDAMRYLVAYIDKVGTEAMRRLGVGFLQGTTRRG